MTGTRRTPNVWWTFTELALGRRRWLILLVAGSSLLAGFVEATTLYVVIKSAAALAGPDPTSVVTLPFLGAVQASVALRLAACLVGFLVLLTAGTTKVTAELAARALTVVRTRLVRAFLHANWETQSAEREGALQEYAVIQPERAALGVVCISNQVAAFGTFLVFASLGLAADLRAATMCIVGGAAVIASFRKLKKRTHRLARGHVDASRGLASTIAEITRVAMEIRVLGVPDTVAARMARDIDTASIPYRRARFLVPFLPRLYQHVALALIIGVVSLMASTGGLEAASVGASIILLVRAMSYAQQGQTASQMMREAAPNASDLQAKITEYETAVPVFGERPLDEVDQLELENVTYAYPDGTPAISGVSLTINRGEIVGIVGPSGSGKSTLVQVLLGLRQPLGGSYSVNGNPASSYDRASWCRQFAFVPQDVRLIRGTIAENIMFERAGLNREAVERAIGKAQLSEEIAQLPDGLATQIGIGVRSMSGGQEQRLGIARAFVTSPSIIVLDEPTSSLDPGREKSLIDELARRHEETTIIIVTHRPTSLTACDRIIEMRDGRLAVPTPVVR